MAKLRVFVSSTCYDLAPVRSQLRIFINSLGYEPIMSEYEDVLYDPRIHTHTSCVDEVANSDILILIIGPRFGGKASAESLNRIDFEMMKNESINVDSLKEKEGLSITQLEVLKAIEHSIPVYTFIDKRVMNDHALYEKNKTSDIVSQIIFPSIEKQKTAKYIFNFINFVRLRTRGNNIFGFDKVQDIEETLKKQWSSYFQRLLNEQRYAESEHKQIDILSEKFEDLKTAILSSIDNGDKREIARGIVKFRRMFDFLFALKRLELNYLKNTDDAWKEVLSRVGIVDVINATNIIEQYAIHYRERTYLITKEGWFYESRLSMETIDELSSDWDAFKAMSNNSRQIIVEALNEMPRGLNPIRLVKRSLDDYLYEKYAKSMTNGEIEKPQE